MASERVDRFTWPPKAPQRDAGGVGVDPDATEATFIEIKPAEGGGASRGGGEGVARAETWWESAERTWLGVTTPPFVQRAKEAGFVPDAPEAYCARCGRTWTGGGHAGFGCGGCEGETAPWNRIIRVGEYEGLLGEVIRELKFQRWRRVGMDLGTLMGAVLGAELRREGIKAERVVVMPVPSHWFRRLVRGVDHAAVLARAAAEGAGVRYAEGLRRRFRPPQGGLGGEARRANMRGTMELRRRGGQAGAEEAELVVVVDDVKTTGATLREASRAVGAGGRGRGGVNVWCLVGAVAGGLVV